MARKNLEIPVWRKYTLSIEEAAQYFHIGEKRLRQIIKDNPVADYLLWNGTHVLIKRKLFEQYIDIVEAV
ncbi:excisionase [bacterium 1xD8-6]|nr:excisionase [Lachnospiraceae bacterium]RKI25577.1 excisionase [bacterium D16-36]RKI68034.1 excisionase [bacterium 1xD8-6]